MPIDHRCDAAARRGRWVWALALVAVLVLPVLYPGDCQFVNDEPMILLLSLKANRTPGHVLGISLPFSLAEHGLQGTHGIMYGPAPEWFYQLLLLLPHDFPLLMLVRAAVVAAGTALGLWWIGKYAGFGKWFVVVGMLSPWTWLYARQLWDNSFCIPLSAICLGAYLGYLATRRGVLLGVAFASLLLLPLIHFMALPVSIAIGLHLVFTQYRMKWRRAAMLIAIFAVIAIAAWPYHQWVLAGNRKLVVGSGVAWSSYLFPLLGGNHFSGIALDQKMGTGWMFDGALFGGLWSVLILAASAVTVLAYPAVWAGMFLAARQAVGKSSHSPKPIRKTLARLCLATLALQILLDGYTRTTPMAHYFNATWIVFAVFAWTTVEVVARFKFGRVVVGIFAGSCAAIILLMLVNLHIYHGDRAGEGFGFPSVGDQQRVYDQMSRYPAGSVVRFGHTQWARWSSAFVALERCRPARHDGHLPRSLLNVRYADQSPEDCRLVLTATPLGD